MPVVRRVAGLYWGVRGELFEEPQSTTDLLEACGEAAKEFGVAEVGEKIGVTAGLPSLKSGGTNLFKVHTVQ
jgi:pyruvate kinase